MKLYYIPNACSLAIHILLEEIGKPYELRLINGAEREQYGPGFTAINPKAKVPVLERDDGSYLTELPAIAWYLARLNPEAGLLPMDIETEAKVLEMIDYLISTVHMRGFTRIFRSELFSPTSTDKEKVQQTGRDIVLQGFDIVAPAFAGDYILGSYSIVDTVLFFLEFWAARRVGMTLPPALDAHLRRMLDRPAVQRALVGEGLV